MIDLIEKEGELLKASLISKEGKEIKLEQILDSLNIDGMQFFDERTFQLIERYHTYKNHIDLAFDYITAAWEYSFSIFNRIYAGGIFG